MRLIRRRRGRTRDDEGFTLIEMVVTVSILGIIAVVLFGVVIQYLKVSGTTRARLSESTDQQFISTYWQTDVSSLGRRSFAAGTPPTIPSSQSVFLDAAGPSGCGASVGAVVVAFAWVEFEVSAADPDNAWNTTAQEVAYVQVGGSAPYKLQRVRCKGDAEGDPVTVAHNLTGKPLVNCDTSCTAAALPNRVTMKFVVRDSSEPADTGYTTTVTADRRQG